MRALLLSAVVAVAALALAPTAGASCHHCVVSDPVVDYLRQFLP